MYAFVFSYLIFHDLHEKTKVVLCPEKIIDPFFNAKKNLIYFYSYYNTLYQVWN